jgi:hypothetical protein
MRFRKKIERWRRVATHVRFSSDTSRGVDVEVWLGCDHPRGGFGG